MKKGILFTSLALLLSTACVGGGAGLVNPRWHSGKKKIRLPRQETQEMRVGSLGWEDLLE